MREEASQLSRAVCSLPERGRRLIGMRYGREMTLVKVGQQLGVKKTRAIQLHQQALCALHRELQRAA